MLTNNEFRPQLIWSIYDHCSTCCTLYTSVERCWLHVPSCPHPYSVLQPWTPPKETNETTGALILAVAGAVLGFSESSDELLILIDVSEDVISIIYVWWYNVIVCYSYTVIIHYNPIYIYIYVCVYHLHDVIFVVYCYVTVVSTSSIRMDGSFFCYDCRMPTTRRWLAEGCGLLLGALLAVIFSNHQHTVSTGFPVPHVQRHSWELGDAGWLPYVTYEDMTHRDSLSEEKVWCQHFF